MRKTGRQLFNQVIKADISKNKAYRHHLLLDVTLRRAPEDSNHPRSCQMLKCHTVHHFGVNSLFSSRNELMDLLGEVAGNYINQNILSVVKYTQFCTVTHESIIN